MAAGAHFGCPKITFDLISIHFTSICNLNFLKFLDKMAAGGLFGCLKFSFDRISGHFRSIGHFEFPKFTFDRNSGHFRSIQNFFFRQPFWMCENHFGSHFWPFQIDRPFCSLSMAFLAISDRYATFFFEIFDKMGAGGHLECPQITFDSISGHFRSIGRFGFPKFTFDRNSGHFRSIQNSFLLLTRT